MMFGPRTTLLILAAALALLFGAAALWLAQIGPRATPAVSPQGILVARPGMSREEIAKASTLALPSGDVGAIAGEGVFEFRLAGAGLTFPGSRAYYIGATGPALSVDRLLISVTGKLTGPERDAAHASTRNKLIADGWKETGVKWFKDGLVLEISNTQVEPPPEGQTAEQAPVWVQSVAIQRE